MSEEGPKAVGNLNPYKKTEAETICHESGIKTEKCSEGGMSVAFIENGDWIKVQGVNFASGAKSFEARVSSANNGGNIEIHLDSPTGKLVGKCPVESTGGWQKWVTKTCDISGAEGIHDVYFKFTGGSGYLFNFNWWKFNPVKASDAETKPSTPWDSKETPGSTVTLKDGWYYIKNVNAQKYLQVTGNSAAASSNVELGSGNKSEGQKWYLKNQGDGYITLTSALGDFMLDVSGGQNKDDANIGIYNAYSGNAQQFMIKSSKTNGAYIVATKCSNLTKVLDDAYNNKSEGANVCQWTYNGQENQQWIFEEVKAQVPGNTVNIQDGWYKIKNVFADKYLQVTDNVGKSSANIEIGSKADVDGQKWYVKNVGNGYITLKSALGEYMIDINGSEDKDGANVQIFNGYGGNAQQFMVKSSEKQGAYVIATKCSDLTKVLDDSNFGKVDGSNVCQWSYGGKDNQLWNFEKISSTIESVEEIKPSGSKPQENKLNLEYKIDKWNPAYQVNFKVTNKTNADVSTWKLKLKKSEITIKTSWNIEVKEDSSYYYISPIGWNSNIVKGGYVEFGIQGSGNIADKLTYTLN